MLLKFKGGISCYKSFNIQRDTIIDLIKGIGILLMVFRHTEAPYSEFVLLFHMAIFFIASGYLINTDKLVDLKSLIRYILRKIKNLWFPYFLYMTVFSLLHNVFINFNIYTDNPCFIEEYTGRYASLKYHMSLNEIATSIVRNIFFMGSEQLGGALWFFHALFLLTIGYAVIEFILRKAVNNLKIVQMLQLIISAAFLCIGYFFYLFDISILGFNRFFSFYCLLHFGQIFKYKIKSKIYESHHVFIATFCFAILLIARPFGYINLSGNEIQNPIYFLIVSISGWFMMFSVAWILKEKKFIGNSLITYISKRSVAIIGLHFLSFKLVSYIAVEIYGIGKYMIAGFPVLMHGWWWIAYMAVGIILPLLADKAYLICKEKHILYSDPGNF